MANTNNPDLTEYSQKLRSNMTAEERKLWYRFLSHLDVTINRQKVCGNYILDFYCASAKTAIEIDSSQHFEEKGKSSDLNRDAYLNSIGITVLRYSNREINLFFDDVCQSILTALSERIPVRFKENT